MQGEVTYEFDGTDPLHYTVQSQTPHLIWRDLGEVFYIQAEAREFARNYGRDHGVKVRVLRFDPAKEAQDG